MQRITLAVYALMAYAPAMAQDATGEALSRECNAAYVRECKGIKRGPELVGKCFEKYPNILAKIPKKCEADFQTNVENYREAKGQK